LRRGLLAGTLDAVDISSTAPASVTVTTASGALRGTRAYGVAAFRGIPYAVAPVGEHRFHGPVPTPAWTGVRDASAPGATAPMPGYPSPFDRLLPNPTVPGDDYLNLTVWTPDPAARGLPVLVWIHGGAFVNGSSVVPTWDGSAFARSGVVTVAINYRLGAEGFALLPDAPPNRGLLDQIAALEWVRDHVATFGGNPDAVTVAGESAGAMSIGALLAMPRAAGLFRRAVLQSGAAHHTLTAATAARVAGYLAAELDVPATAAALATVPSARVIGAQNALTAQLQAAPDPARWGEVVANLMPFEPVVDGDVLPGPPLERIAAGSAAGVDVLVGANRHEYRLFLVPTGVADRITEPALAAVAAGYRLPEGALDRYRAASPGASPGELMAEVMTDWFYRIPALRLAEAHPGSHVYEFGWESPVDGLGACHALEVPFVFGTLDDPGSAALTGPAPPHELSDAMHRAWVAFATTGDPGWPAYTPDRRAVARFGAGADPRVAVLDDPRGALRELWAGIR
jgi:para-nitrobenzyl esterase